MDWKERHLEDRGDYRILKQQIQDILLVQTCKRKNWNLSQETWKQPQEQMALGTTYGKEKI